MPIFFCHIVLAVLLVVGAAAPALSADESDLDVLRMFYDERDLDVGVTRNTVPLSSVAETVTVITADDIRAMNAHTVADVLANVPGLQQEVRGAPGSINSIYIRGGSFMHVRVLLDGVTINSIISSAPDLDAIPAHIVERIEVMKGPASASWGSALGGVINIVTKSPADERKGAGALYASGGESGFHDMNLQLSGTQGGLGYYASGGHLGESGLTARSSVAVPNAYGKLRWQPTAKFSLAGSLLFLDHRFANGEGVIEDIRSTQLLTAMTATYVVRPDLDVELSGRGAFEDLTRRDTYLIFGPDPIRQKLRNNAHTLGGSGLVRWHTGDNALIAGFDYDGGDSRMTGDTRKKLSRCGLFLTDTLTLGPLSVTSGIRYDWANGVMTRRDVSPSIGLAWRVGEGTIVRVSAAKGYNLPEIVDPTTVKIWSVQGGVETTEVPYLWLRGTVFYNDLRDYWVSGKGFDDIRRYGGEVEFRTIPVYNVSLSGGVMIMTSESRTTGKIVDAEPRTSWNVGLRYDDGRGTSALLQGRQIDWNPLAAAGPFDLRPRSGDFIWDLHLAKKLRLDRGFDPELFFSLHNIFEGRQYLYQYWKSPGRWAEGGIRFSF